MHTYIGSTVGQNARGKTSTERDGQHARRDVVVSVHGAKPGKRRADGSAPATRKRVAETSRLETVDHGRTNGDRLHGIAVKANGLPLRRVPTLARLTAQELRAVRSRLRALRLVSFRSKAAALGVSRTCLRNALAGGLVQVAKLARLCREQACHGAKNRIPRKVSAPRRDETSGALTTTNERLR